MNIGQQFGKVGNNINVSAGLFFSDALAADVSIGAASQNLVMQEVDAKNYQLTGFGTNKIISGMLNGYYHINTYSHGHI